MVLPGTLPAAPPPERTPRRHSERWRLGVGGGVAAVVLIVVIQMFANAAGSGSYAFLQMQGDVPATWNHCHAIPYQVNPKGAPPGWDKIVHDAVSDIATHSGFVFADKGTTTKTQLIGSRYQGNEWEPVLIVWKDSYQDSALAGNTIGFGGGRTLTIDGIPRYVIGQVTLDSDVRDAKQARLVLEHELGHVLGLDHVSDPNQLMFPSYHGQSGLGEGDINGLKKLHDVPCTFS